MKRAKKLKVSFNSSGYSKRFRFRLVLGRWVLYFVIGKNQDLSLMQ